MDTPTRVKSMRDEAKLARQVAETWSPDDRMLALEYADFMDRWAAALDRQRSIARLGGIGAPR
jgi:hypothetical protein